MQPGNSCAVDVRFFNKRLECIRKDVERMLTKFAYKQFIRVGVRDVGRRVGSALCKCVNFTCLFLGAIAKQLVYDQGQYNSRSREKS